MELKINIGYQEVLELIRQMSPSQLEGVRAVLEEKEVTENKSKTTLQQLLLNGPVMDDEQYKDFLEQRQLFTWREI